MKRQIRAGEHVCICNSYNFPHRMFAGKCTKQKWVETYWENPLRGNLGCANCPSRAAAACQVYEGQESAEECRVLQNFIAFHEIKN